jgi:hypothetical protein
MVFEDAEELVETNIDGGWLDHCLFKRLDPHTLGIDLGTDIAVTE